MNDCQAKPIRRMPGPGHLLSEMRLRFCAPRRRAAAVCRGPRGASRVALTFDDGPDPRWTPAILDALDEAAATATFFFLGPAIERHPELAQRAAGRHQIGTHLCSHSRASVENLADFDRELAGALDTHRRVLGQRPKALRFPFGYCGRIRARDLDARDVRAYHWSLSSRDYRARSAGEIVDYVAPRLGPGAIVLLHDGRGPHSTEGPGHREATVAALPRLLNILTQRGLEPVTLDALGGLSGRGRTTTSPYPRLFVSEGISQR